MEHKKSLDPTIEQAFIPQRIVLKEYNTEPQNTSITTNNLSLSPVPEDFTMVFHGCINFNNTNGDYNKYAACEECLGHQPSCHYLDNENDGEYEDYNDMKGEDIQSNEDTLSTIREEIVHGLEFDHHHQVVEQEESNGYHHISSPANDNSSITNEDNIPAIIMDIDNFSWEYYKQHRK